ncbi:AhpC/TSA family protein [Hymenobacter sp. UV11]|jgi:peroxiredoxin|uniref:TlpA family protein disulfide reductase n=1 Tax=Hymenobacter sp. UV11 TaxID=1849735 RepID=UPI0010600C37|nr:TlpA disulfide reductase family protein [Hymenobacter sp. UV11]TFZ64254.1 AhpC/TSA family protein [Hymenobacter sp. UV11]
MHLHLLFSLLLCLLPALPSQAQQPQPLTSPGYTIEGRDPRLASRHVYLLAAERPSHTQPWPALDSTQADATGHFVLHGRVPAPDVYWLRLDKQRVLQPVPLAGRQEHLNGSVELAPSSTRQAPVYQLHLSGSPEVEWLQALLPYGLLRNQAAAANDKHLRQLQAQLRQRTGSYLAPYVAFHYLRLHPSARPLLDSLTTRFAREQPACPYLPRLRELLDKAPTLAVGALAPDFTLTDLHGQSVALSSLQGRYVLVDFWASWCKPCRAENPHVLAAYQRFRDQGVGFTVLSVSLDEKPGAWQQAVQQDGLPWTQVADLQGLRGPTGNLYQLVGIPATFLLDPEGRIVAKDLRGADLKQVLARHLN